MKCKECQNEMFQWVEGWGINFIFGLARVTTTYNCPKCQYFISLKGKKVVIEMKEEDDNDGGQLE